MGRKKYTVTGEGVSGYEPPEPHYREEGRGKTRHDAIKRFANRQTQFYRGDGDEVTMCDGWGTEVEVNYDEEREEYVAREKPWWKVW